jgi:hypothetical protein
VASVDGSGLVTGVAEGTATITATSLGHSGIAVVKVRRRPSAPVASVTVTPATASVAVGQTVQLAATPKDASGNALAGRVVTWASSAPAMATVNASGLVTGVAAGAATITATSEGQSGTAPITVTAPTPSGCFTSTGTWQNSTIPSQTGTFELQFDATPNSANMDGVVGLSNGAAADFPNLAAIGRFNPGGTIDARNGAVFAAAGAVPYTAGSIYHFRLDVNIPAHSYDIYVTPAGSTERLLGGGFAFRTEQAAVSVLSNLGVFANVGTGSSDLTACGIAIAPWTPVVPPPPPPPPPPLPPPPDPPPPGLGEIDGTAFNDVDASGWRAADEPGLFGWVIELRGPVSRDTTTDDNGNYVFTGLPGGTYLVCEVPQSGWSLTVPMSGSACSKGGFGYTVVIPDAVDIRFLGNDFGTVVVTP